MKKYIFPFLIFSIAGGLGMILYKVFETHFSKEVSSIILRSFLSLVFIAATIKLSKPKNSFWKFQNFTREKLALTSGLLLLFACNNYLHSKYGSNFDFSANGPISLVVMGFVVNSFFEEFAYRGFLQGYVNQKLKKPSSPISQGNVFASLLMTVTHLGFFQIMDLPLALSSTFLVLVFSLVMGYLRDRGCSIWFLIITHTLVNIIHLLLNIEAYR